MANRVKVIKCVVVWGRQYRTARAAANAFAHYIRNKRHNIATERLGYAAHNDLGYVLRNVDVFHRVYNRTLPIFERMLEK